MFEEELKELRGINNGICVSIVVPTHRLSEERAGDPVRVKNAVHSAELALSNKYGEQNIKKLVGKIKDTVNGIDFVHETDGLGIYVSNNYSKVIRFPFPVEEKIIINGRFHTRELIYGNKSFLSYYLLVLSRKGTRLFRNEPFGLREITDKNFPAKFTDDYEYPKAHLATPVSFSLKGEGDKSIIEETRLRDFLRNVDEAAGIYIKNGSKVMLAGIQQHLSYFQEVRRHTNEIIGTLEGNYDHYNINNVAKLADEAAAIYVRKKTDELIRSLEEKKGVNKVVSGFERIREAVTNGNADTLIVEKDFKGESSALSRTARESGKVTPADGSDAVTELIEGVIEKKGNVVFVDNGLLENFERIALLLRYSSV